MTKLETLKIKITDEIQNFIDRATPIFEAMETIEEVEKGVDQLVKANEGGRNAILKSSITTDAEKDELILFFDMQFSEVYNLAANQKIMLKA